MKMKKSLQMLRTGFAMVAMMLLLTANALAAMPDWENAVITVEGMGAAPPNVINAVQGRMLAKRAATVDAQRQLAEVIQGVNVTAETTVEQMAVVNDTVRTHVQALVKGARVIDEKDLPGGGYSVTMQVSMYGVSNSLASSLFDKQTQQETFPDPVPQVEASRTVTSVNISVSTATSDDSPNMPQEYATEAPAGKAVGDFTGLIVDCRGLELNPVMSPVIKNESGQPIYGYKNLDPDMVITNGMAGYANDMDGTSRAGSHPLCVKAVRLDDHNGNPVISVADANRVLIENDATGFLSTTSVVFLR